MLYDPFIERRKQPNFEDLMKEALRDYKLGVAVRIIGTDGSVLHQPENRGKWVAEHCITDVDPATFRAGNYDKLLERASQDAWNRLKQR